jgi:hypothetical protein
MHAEGPCLVPYINKTVVEMQSQQLCRQVGIRGDMFPCDILDNHLCAWTGFLIESLPEAAAASMTDSKNA